MEEPQRPTKVEIKKKFAFVLTPKTATKIFRLCEEFDPNPVITWKFSDDIVQEVASLRDFLDLENPKNCHLVSVRFSARAPDFSSYIEVNFETEFLHSIKVDVSGQNDKVRSARGDANELLMGCKAWYSPIARLQMFYLAILTAGIFIFVGFDIARKISGGQSEEFTATSAVVYIGIIVAIYLGAFVIGLLKGKVFPAAEFRIGQGDERAWFREKIQWAVVVGFIVSVMGSFAHSLFW